MKIKYIFASFLLTMVTHQAFSAEPSEEKHKASLTRQTTLESESSIGVLLDELLINIFSFLKQKDVPPVAGTCQRWQRLMDDNELWKNYAKRAHLIMDDGDNTRGRNYKELVKYHCTYSFDSLNTLNINNETESWIHKVNFDGSEILGEAEEGYKPRKRHEFKWTREKGMELLGTLDERKDEPPLLLYVNGMNGGTVHINTSMADNMDAQEFSKQLAWFQEALSQPLISPDVIESQTEMVNFDASMVADWLSGITPEPKFLTAACEVIRLSKHGMEALQQLLTDKGLLPCDWTLRNVKKITASRTVLVGQATFLVMEEDGFPQSLERAWHAVIPRGNLF